MAQIDEVARFWNARPCNVRHSSKPIGSREYFEEVSAKKFFVEPHLVTFAEFERWRGKRVLDLGCGIGTVAARFAECGAEVVGVDISAASLELARQRFAVFKVPGVLLNGNFERLDELVSGTFDLIWAFGTIHHSPNPPRVVEKLGALLNPGGAIKVMLYSRYSSKGLGLLAKSGFQFWRYSEIVERYSEAQEGSPVTHLYSLREARRLFAAYQIKSIRKRHIFKYQLQPYLRHQYRVKWYWRLLPDWLERVLGWHTLIEAGLA